MIYTVAEVVATILDTVFVLWFVPSFLHTKFYYKKNLPALIVPVLYLAFELIADKIMAGFDMLALAIEAVLAVVYAILICNRKWFRAIVAGISYILVMVFIGSITFPIFSMILKNGMDVLQGAEHPARLIYLAVAKFLQFFLLRLLLFLFKADKDLDRKNGILSLLYSVFTIVGLGALMAVSVSDKSGSQSTPIIVLLAVLLLSNAGVYLMIRQAMRMHQKEYEYRLIQEKMNAEKKRAEDAEVIWENIRKLRHDLKNHFTVIRAGLDDGDTASCGEYLNKIYPVIDSMDNLVYTENAMVDYLISTKFTKDKDVKIITSGNVNYFDDIEDADLVSLIGNILDNAIEAAEQVIDPMNRRVELHFLRQELNRVIICKNGINGSVLEHNKELRSTKRQGDHGLGHRIINSIAQKYGGFAEFFEGDGMFYTHVVLSKAQAENAEMKNP